MQTLTSNDCSTRHRCEFCKKSFQKESTLMHHMCVTKQRFKDIKNADAQLAFRVYQRFYETSMRNKIPRTVEEFISSNYYSDFIRFSRYLIQVNPFSTQLYVDYVLRNNLKIKHWISPETFQSFVILHNRKEPVNSALERSIKTIATWAERKQAPLSSYFEEVAAAELTDAIRYGKISPWVIYLSDSAMNAMTNRLDADQHKAISNIVDVKMWKIIFIRRADDVKFVVKILKEAEL